MIDTAYRANQGDLVLDAVPWFFRRRLGCTVVELAAFDTVPPVQQRLPAVSPGQAALEQETALYGPLGVPFWEGVLLASAATGWDDTLLSAALFHQEAAQRELLRLDLKPATVQAHLGGLEQRLAEDQFWAVTSRLGNGLHCPMLDFSLEANERNKEAVLKMVRSLSLRGMLVHSGASYHFYGYPSLDEDAWRRFLGKALLYAPLVDGRWIAHQLQQGFCALRLTAGGRTGALPSVAEHV